MYLQNINTKYSVDLNDLTTNYYQTVPKYILYRYFHTKNIEYILYKNEGGHSYLNFYLTIA